jgi:hypothetical protein
LKKFHGLTGLASFLLLAVTAWPAHAGYEYATPTSNCAIRSDVAGDNKNLRIYPGTTRFEVFGNLVDVATTNGHFRFDVSANFSARVVSARTGPENFARGCGAIGSAVIEVSKPVGDATTAANHWIEIRMPTLGDWTRVPITVLPFPNYALTWSEGSLQPGAGSCLLSGDGSFRGDINSTRATIQLPVGHSRDDSACSGQFVELLATPTSNVNGDLPVSSCSISVQGLPAWLTLADPSISCAAPGTPVPIKVNIDALRLRRLSSEAVSRVTVRGGNPDLTSAVATLVVRPNLALMGVTPPSPQVTAGELVDLQLAFLSSPGVVTWRLTRSACFRHENRLSPYYGDAAYQYLTVPAGQTRAFVRIRSVAKGECAGKPIPVQHVFEAWIGDQRVNPNVVNTTTSGYARATISLLAPALF